MQLTQNKEILHKQEKEQTGSTCLQQHSCLCTFYLTRLFVRKYILLTGDDCFAFHGGKNVHFVRCAILIHKLYVVLGCLEVKLL